MFLILASIRHCHVFSFTLLRIILVVLAASYDEEVLYKKTNKEKQNVLTPLFTMVLIYIFLCDGKCYRYYKLTYIIYKYILYLCT